MTSPSKSLKSTFQPVSTYPPPFVRNNSRGPHVSTNCDQEKALVYQECNDANKEDIQKKSRSFNETSVDLSSSSDDLQRSQRLRNRESQDTIMASSFSGSYAGVRRFITREQQNFDVQSEEPALSKSDNTGSIFQPHVRKRTDLIVKETICSPNTIFDLNGNNLEEKDSDMRMEFSLSPMTDSDNSCDWGAAKVKDKSAKRKSSLNTANVLEAVLQTPVSGRSPERRSRGPHRNQGILESSESDNKSQNAREMKGLKRDFSSDTQTVNSSVRWTNLEHHSDNRRQHNDYISKTTNNALKRPEIPEVLERDSSPFLNHSIATDCLPHFWSSTPKRPSLTEDTEVSRCDFNLSLSGSCCLSSEKLSDNSFHSVSQVPDSEPDVFETPPETLSKFTPPFIHFVNNEKETFSFDDFSETVVEAVNLKPFAALVQQNEGVISQCSKTLTSILKCKTADESWRGNVQSILKVQSGEDVHDELKTKPPSILKKGDSLEKSEEEDFQSGLLNPVFRQFVEIDSSLSQSIARKLDDNISQPKPILKKGPLLDDSNLGSASVRSNDVPRPILKRKVTKEGLASEEKLRPILKSRQSHEDMTETMKHAFESDPDLLLSILRKPVVDKNDCDFGELRRADSDVAVDSSVNSHKVSGDSSSAYNRHLGKFEKFSVEMEALGIMSKDNNATGKMGTVDSKSVGGLRVSDGVGPSSRERTDRRNSARYRTQPVTLVEVQESDNLESVQNFRTLITTKASLHVFEEEEEETTEKVEKENHFRKEYPQRYRPERRKDRRTNNRYRTLPITFETPLEETTNCCDSSTCTSSSTDEVCNLNVLEKASLFHQKALESRGLIRRSSDVRGRIQSRRSNPRSQTQPITEEEVHEAARILDGIKKDKEGREDKSDNEPSKLSLMEKMQLFNQKIQEEKKPRHQLEKGPRRRRSGGHTRFKTQPVTTEEVCKASRLSLGGLAKALKPPDLEEDETWKIAPTLVSPLWSRRNVTKEVRNSSNTDVTNVPVRRTVANSLSQSDFLNPLSQCHSLNKKLYSDANLDKEIKPDKVPPKTSRDSSSDSARQRDWLIKSASTKKSSRTLSPESDHDEKTSPFSEKKLRSPPFSDNKDPIWNVNEAYQWKTTRHPQLDLPSVKVLQQTPPSSNARGVSSALHGRAEGDTPGYIPSLLQRKQKQPESPKTPLESKPSVEGGSIKQRLAALQKSGSEDWQKRLFQSPEKASVLQTSLDSANEEDSSLEEVATSVAGRLNKLQKSSEQWRHRVEEKDAVQFTVAGKMAAAKGVEAVNGVGALSHSPSVERRCKKIALPVESQKTDKPEKVENNATAVVTGFLPKSLSVPVVLGNLMSDPSEDESDGGGGHHIRIPKPDNETFSSFFDSPKFLKCEVDKEVLKISTEALDLITSHSHRLSIQHRKVQVHRRHTGARNPIRALASRVNFQKQEYMEVASTGVAQKEMQRIQVEKLAKTSDKSLSALAGLASAEDFKKINLRKGEEGGTALLPVHKVMLVQIKGRRHVQTRLVEPCPLSLNQGDSYVLATPTKVFCWIGPYTNVIERSKVLEVASVAHLKKDLCFKGTSPPVVIDLAEKEDSDSTKNHSSPRFTSQDVREFNALLGNDKITESSVLDAKDPEEDELYESSIICTNMMYMLKEGTLVPHEEYWGALPKVEALKNDQVFVFDFGSEMYVWKGKQSSQQHRSLAMKLARQLWERGYDYSGCSIDPIKSSIVKGERAKSGLDESVKPEGKVYSVRPQWCIFASINQHMEPVLFREKFLDWPDNSRLIKVKGQEDDTDSTAKPVEELKPCDAREMLSRPCPDPDLILEMQNVGRGVEWQDLKERRIYEITSLEVDVWHILEYESRRLPFANGQFHSGDTYVVRWKYMVTQRGRSLQGELSRHSFTGRQRCAYFFWQGSQSSITEKGASALMTVELDEERGPQVRVKQGEESPCFLAVFQGRMIIYRGEREDESTNTPGPWKLFVVRGLFSNEVFLVEVEAKGNSLRSRACFLLINCTTGLIHLWYGCHTSSEMRDVAKQAAENIIEVQPEEMWFESGAVLKVVEVFQGSEPKIFMEALSISQDNFKLTASTKSSDAEKYSPRLFHLSSISGTFLAHEVLSPFRSPDRPSLLPFLQEDLYGTPQPGLFLLDPCGGDCLYLWQGWWPEGNEETTNVSTGSATMRWNANRRCAMQTALDYAKAKRPDSPPKVLLVSAGLEPRDFTDLFPEWHQDEHIAQLNLQEGKQKMGECLDVSQVLAQLTRSHYSLAELQQSLPEGVDPMHIEKYLSESEFQTVMKMSKEKFYELPKWKQTKLKKEAQLF